MTDQERAAMQQALEFLENGNFVYPTQLADDLRAALAQEPEPVQEPVALLWQVRHALNLACAICDAVPNRDPGHLGVLVNAQQQDGRNGYRLIHDAEAALTKYLTTPTITPPQRPPLTDEEIDKATAQERDALLDHIYEYGTAAEGVLERIRKLCRAVERRVRGE